MRISCYIASLLLLTACEAQSSIQSKYMGQQEDCRDTAEDQMDNSVNMKDASSKQRNAQLVDYFSTCMIKSGWHVARPVKNPIVPTPPGTAKTATEAALPAQPVKAAPPAVRSAAPAAAAAAVSEPVKTETTPLQPSPSTPALSQPVEPTQPLYAPGRHF